MRKRFEQQLTIGLKPIQETEIPSRSRDSIAAILEALKEIFICPEYNEKIFNILEDEIIKGKKKTGRPGMDLWQIFVLAQFRLALNINYDILHNLSNHHSLLRQILGIETESGYEKIEIGYQSIIDNVSLLSDETVKEINKVIVVFGHDVFKKKEAEALRLKTDSFVVKSNVHFPTDYNLLWDSARKCLDTVNKFLNKYPNIPEWRKIKNWNRETKGFMRELGKASSSGGKNKEARQKKAAKKYLTKAKALQAKLVSSRSHLTVNDNMDMAMFISFEHFMELLNKQIDLVDRRLIKGEKIPHQEKIFSIFEDYTEWITKGKMYPNVELGKNCAITTDHFNLIVDYQIMEHEADSKIVVTIADRIISTYKVDSWSFDRGFWHKDNKSLLQLKIPKVIMPKKGKRNKFEREEEKQNLFIRLKNKHSAIESNINELEHRGLNKCPDRGYEHFKRYVGLAVSAYNLHRIGKELIKLKCQETKKSFKLCA